jgi:DNA replication protein DnaC
MHAAAAAGAETPAGAGAAPLSPSPLARVPGVCRECGQAFAAVVMKCLGFEVRQRACEACVAAERRRQEERERPRLTSFEAAWMAVCPPDYRDTDEARLRRDIAARGGSMEKVEQVLQWRPGMQGLALVGETRRHKSRLMFLLMKRLLREGRSVRYMNAVHFGDDIAASYEGGPSAYEDWMRKLERADVLFLDDLGKEKGTERVAVALYRLAEYRTAHQRHTFYTSNFGRSGLVEKWKLDAQRGHFFDDKAEPTAERFAELCRSVQM